jgi:hypothetical protein
MLKENFKTILKSIRLKFKIIMNSWVNQEQLCNTLHTIKTHFSVAIFANFKIQWVKDGDKKDWGGERLGDLN